MSVTYTVGDTREAVKGIPDGSVDLIASSPPFLALRSYVPADHESKGDEIGSERNPAEFIDMLLGLTAEWGRVLAAHGSIAIELGDTYSGSGGGGGDYLPGGLRYGQVGFDGSAAREHNAANWRQKNQRVVGTREHRPERDGTGADGGERVVPVNGGTGWPRAKSLALIPQLYAVALAYGINPLTGAPSPAGRWLVRNVIVWHRPNPAVGALGDKVRPSTSYIVVATRSPKRWFDLTAVRGDVSANSHGGGTWSTQGGADGSVGEIAKTLANPAGAPPLDAWFDEHDFHDTWTLTTQPSRLAHYAMWPAKLAERLILMMCPREVCRVCGEPRRRMEKATDEYSRLGRGWADFAEGRHKANGRERNNHSGQPPGAHITSAQYDTLGWTDCNGRHAPSDAPYYRPGLVLDPFAGSGTTLAVADLHGRDAIGVDFDARNKAIYPARIGEVKRALYGTPAPMPGQETFDFAI